MEIYKLQKIKIIFLRKMNNYKKAQATQWNQEDNTSTKLEIQRTDSNYKEKNHKKF